MFLNSPALNEVLVGPLFINGIGLEDKRTFGANATDRQYIWDHPEHVPAMAVCGGVGRLPLD